MDKRFTSPNAIAADGKDGASPSGTKPLRAVAAASAGTKASCLSDALEFIRTSLEGLSLGTKEANRAQLMAEESLVRLVEQGDFEKGGAIQVSIRRFLGRVTINLTVPGKEFDFVRSLEVGAPLDDEEMSPDTAEAIQNILLRSFEDRIKYRHRRGYNRISVTAVRSPLASLYWTLGALFMAVVVGLLLKAFASPAICDALNGKIFIPVQTVFMNGLKLCAAPVVFLSIASCVAQFGDLSEIRRIGARLLASFTLMQCIAAGIGIGVFYLFQPGRGVEIAASGSAVPQGASLSVTEALVNLMPSNIIKPFLEGDMLQLIVLAVFVGSSVGALGATTIRNLLDEGNGVFMKIMGALMRFVPLIVFCSIASLILTAGSATLFSLLGLVGMIFAGYAALLAVYTLITAFWCRLNPARLFLKSLPMTLTAFSTCSSVAAMPESMKAAGKLGISPKVYSLSIPLGCTLNTNGTCMYVVAGSLFLARAYGVEVSPSALCLLFFSSVALVMGGPSVTGAAIIVFSILASQLGVPIEAVGLIIGINSVLDMFDTPVNCFGNLFTALAAASRAGMLDEEVYNA